MNILTVIYHETEAHYQMALKTWKSLPEGSQVVAVVNKKLEGKEYPQYIHYIENDENCLSKAWNMGLKYFFDKGDDYIFVSGLDSISPTEKQLNDMIDYLKQDPNSGITAAVSEGLETRVPTIQHGDSSFSFFLINKKTFEDVGDFDENFKPAYFEDNDYLERLWKKGYIPIKMLHIKYFHIIQGTLKHGDGTKKNYPTFMQKNLEYFKKKWGKVPDHLPIDIRFK